MDGLLYAAFTVTAGSPRGEGVGVDARSGAIVDQWWPETNEAPGNLADLAFPEAADEEPRALFFGAERGAFVVTQGDGSRRYGFVVRLLPAADFPNLDRPRRMRFVVGVLLSQTGELLLPWLQELVSMPAPAPGRTLLLPSAAAGLRAAVRDAGGPIMRAASRGSAAHDAAAHELALHEAAFRCAASTSVAIPCSHIHPWAGVELEPLLSRLSPRQIVDLLCALLSEHRILVVGSAPGLVSRCSLALASILAPLEWSHILVPLLPPHLLAYASAPTPYILGIRRCDLAALDATAVDSPVVVDLDRGGIHYGGSTPVPTVTADALSLDQLNADALGVRLARDLDPLCSRARHGEPLGEVEPRVPFLTFFARLLWRYRSHLAPVTVDRQPPAAPPPRPSDVFDEDGFLAEPHDSSVAALLRSLVGTQLWHHYVIQQASAARGASKSAFEHAIAHIAASGWTWTPCRRFFLDGWLGQTRAADDEAARWRKLVLDATSNTVGRVSADQAVRGVCAAVARHHCCPAVEFSLRARFADAARHPRHGEAALSLVEAILVAAPPHSVFVAWRAVGAWLLPMMQGRGYTAQNPRALAQGRERALWSPLGPHEGASAPPRCLPFPRRIAVRDLALEVPFETAHSRRQAPAKPARRTRAGRTLAAKGLRSVLAHGQKFAAAVAAAAVAMEAGREVSRSGHPPAEIVASFPAFRALHSAARPLDCALQPHQVASGRDPGAGDADLLSFADRSQSGAAAPASALPHDPFVQTDPQSWAPFSGSGVWADPFDPAALGGVFDDETRQADGHLGNIQGRLPVGGRILSSGHPTEVDDNLIAFEDEGAAAVADSTDVFALLGLGRVTSRAGEPPALAPEPGRSTRPDPFDVSAAASSWPSLVTDEAVRPRPPSRSGTPPQAGEGAGDLLSFRDSPALVPATPATASVIQRPAFVTNVSGDCDEYGFPRL